jgi:signal peptidase
MASHLSGPRVARRLLDLALIVLIGLALFAVVLGRLVPLTGREVLIIGGGSMEPAVHLGAVIVVEPVAPADLRVGDIVSLRTGSGLASIFTHRVERIVSRADGLWIETKGDANNIVDPSLTPGTNVVGRVAANIPYAGFLLRLLSIPSGTALFVCLAGVLVALSWLVESYEQEQRTRRRLVVPESGAALHRGTAVAGMTLAERIAK